MAFKVGQRVKMNLKGKERYPNSLSNPHNLLGVITSASYFSIYVKWDNGETNRYDKHHLMLTSNYNINWVYCSNLKVIFNKEYNITININGKKVDNKQLGTVK